MVEVVTTSVFMDLRGEEPIENHSKYNLILIMKKSCEECVSEIKKRPGEKALCLSELAMLRDVHYVNYKVEKSVLELLIQYCCDCIIINRLI